MASATVSLPFKQDATIYAEMDWTEIKFTFYNDVDETDPVDFTGSTFTGEVLDKSGGAKLFDLTFNSPTDDGVLWPQLSDTNSATLSGTTNHYFVYVTDSAGIKRPYFSGKLTISDDYKAGA